MGTKTVTKTNEVQKNEAPSWAAPGLSELGRRITDIIPSVPGQKYTGDFQALPGRYDDAVAPGYAANAQQAQGFAPMLQAAAQQGLNTPASFQGPGLDAGTGSFGQYDPRAVHGVINSAIQPVMRNLTENVLPGLQSAGIESGAYGGTRSMETLPGMALRDASGQMSEIASRIAYQDFSDQQNRALQSFGLGTQRGLGEADLMTNRLAQFPAMLDSVMRMQTGATDMNAQAAAYDRQLRQSQIDNDIAKAEYGIRQPFQGLDVAANLLGNLATPWGIRTSTGSQSQSTGGMGPILQGAMGIGMAAMGAPGGMGSLGGMFKSAVPAASNAGVWINPNPLQGRRF